MRVFRTSFFWLPTLLLYQSFCRFHEFPLRFPIQNHIYPQLHSFLFYPAKSYCQPHPTAVPGSTAQGGIFLSVFNLWQLRLRVIIRAAAAVSLFLRRYAWMCILSKMWNIFIRRQHHLKIDFRLVWNGFIIRTYQYIYIIYLSNASCIIWLIDATC